MPIIEALIFDESSKKTILQCTSKTHNMTSYIDTILNMKRTSDKLVYELSDSFFVSILISNQLGMLCLHTAEISLQKAFHFLERVKDEIVIQIENRQMDNDDLEAEKIGYVELEKLILWYNTHENVTALEILKEELRSTSNLMIVNLNKIQERSEKIEVLQEKMKGLILTSGYNFRKKRNEEISATLKKKNERRSRCKKVLIILLICLAMLGMIALGFFFSFCGGFNFENCKV